MPHPSPMAASRGGSCRRISHDTVNALRVAGAAIGVLFLVAGCGKPEPRGQAGEARTTTEVEGDTTGKKSRGGLGDLFKIPEPVDEDAEPSQGDDTSDSE